MKFDKGDVWRPPHCEFIGVYSYERKDFEASPDEDIVGYVPDDRDIVPSGVPFFAVVREKDGFTDTPSADELAYSLEAHGYDYEIVRRRPPEVDAVSESEFFDKLEDAEEGRYESRSPEEAHEIACEQIGYDPYMEEDTNLVFYWPSV